MLDPSSTSNARAKPVGAADDGDKINILLVDDRPANLLTYEAALGELGEKLAKAFFRTRERCSSSLKMRLRSS